MHTPPRQAVMYPALGQSSVATSAIMVMEKAICRCGFGVECLWEV